MVALITCLTDLCRLLLSGGSTGSAASMFAFFAWMPYAYKINCDTGGYILFNPRLKELQQFEKDQYVPMSWNMDFPSRLREFDSGPSWKKWIDLDKTSKGPEV